MKGFKMTADFFCEALIDYLSMATGDKKFPSMTIERISCEVPEAKVIRYNATPEDDSGMAFLKCIESESLRSGEVVYITKDQVREAIELHYRAMVKMLNIKVIDDLSFVPDEGIKIQIIEYDVNSKRERFHRLASFIENRTMETCLYNVPDDTVFERVGNELMQMLINRSMVSVPKKMSANELRSYFAIHGEIFGMYYTNNRITITINNSETILYMEK